MMNGITTKKKMTLNNTYEISEEGIKEVLDKVGTFVINMEKFRSRHSGYDYKVELNNNNDNWSAKIKITNGKQKGNRIPDSTI